MLPSVPPISFIQNVSPITIIHIDQVNYNNNLTSRYIREDRYRDEGKREKLEYEEQYLSDDGRRFDGRRKHGHDNSTKSKNYGYFPNKPCDR